MHELNIAHVRQYLLEHAELVILHHADELVCG